MIRIRNTIIIVGLTPVGAAPLARGQAPDTRIVVAGCSYGGIQTLLGAELGGAKGAHIWAEDALAFFQQALR